MNTFVIKFQDSSDDLSDLMREETTDLDELSESDQPDFNEDPIPLNYNTDPILEGDQIFQNLSEFSDKICDENLKNVESYFTAYANGVYLREGLKPYMPLKADTRVENDRDVPIIPKADFVAIFAIGIK